MDTEIKNGLQTLILAFLYILLFLMLLPPLVRLLDMDSRWGKILYGALVACGLVVAFRLRALSRRWS